MISDTGIQLYTVPGELVLDTGNAIVRPLRFSEYSIGEVTYLDWVYYFPGADKYVRRSDLEFGGYISPEGEIADEEDINFTVLTTLKQEDVLSVGRLNQLVGDKRLPGLEQLEGKWIPLPMFESDVTGMPPTPTNWVRAMLSPVKEKSTDQKKVYRLILAIDTRINPDETGEDRESPDFDGQALKHYSLCGVSHTELDKLSRMKRTLMENVEIPLRDRKSVV